MQLATLNPAAEHRHQFLWSANKEVPDSPGCYALVAFDGTVLYVGLASSSLRTRMGAHLDDGDKRKGVAGKIPYWFHYRTLLTEDVRRVERGWLNQSILIDGCLPPLNRVHSPI